MRSIPQALIWELWRHGRWNLLGGLLIANLVPVLLFTALRFDGGVDPEHFSFLMLHLTLVPINGFVFAAQAFAAQGNLARLYTMPASTPTLVTWHLVPLMVLVGVESAASTAMLNAQFGLGWPVWGPALFAAVMVAAIVALHWLTEHSGWEFVAMLTVPLALGLWFKARYGAVFSTPEFFWRQIMPAEGATLAGIALLAYAVAVYGAARNRRGEPLRSLGLIAWVERLLDSAPYRDGRFRSPAAAQFWFEWRQKGGVTPAATALGLILGLALWLIASRDSQALLEGLIAGGGLLAVAALVGGLAMGNCGPTDADYAMAGFLATRPLTNAAMSRAILTVSLLGVALAWLIWALAIALFFPLHAFLGVAAPPWPGTLGWWFFPAAFVGAWATLGSMTTIGLLGHARLFVYLVSGLLGGLTLLQAAMKFTLTLAQQRTCWEVVVASGAVALTLASGWAFGAARRRKLIGWTTVYLAASLWLALASLVAATNMMHARERHALFAALVAACALAVAPLATAPLALAYNRQR